MQLIEIDQRVGRVLRLREQPRAPCKPGISIAPLPDLVGRGRTFDLDDRIQVHAVRLRGWLTAELVGRVERARCARCA